MEDFKNLSIEALLLCRELFFEDVLDVITERLYPLGYTIIKSFFKTKYGYLKGFEDDIKNIYMLCVKTAYEKYQLNSGVDFVKFFSQVVRFKCTTDIIRKSKDYIFDCLSLESEDELALTLSSSEEDPKSEYQKTELIDRIDNLKNSSITIESFTFAEAFDITMNFTLEEFLQKFPEFTPKKFYYITSRVKNYIKISYKK